MCNRLFGKLGITLWLTLAGLLASVNVYADLPITSVFPNTGEHKARLVQDKNQIALMELSGNYDRERANREVNIEPRTVVAKEFFRTHQDRYDFLVIFTTFEFETGDALAFHMGVQNQVKGVGLPLFDNTAHFGSQGKLQGYIDMAALNRYVSNPFDAGFDRVLQVFSHEFMHQWGSHVSYRNGAGEVSGALLGKDDAHWSFLLNSGASVQYGNQWRDNGNGTFTSVANGQFFSPLDLYLMGMYKKEEVPPFFLIENPDIDRRRMPQNDVTISGTRKEISVNDVIAAEGQRLPAASDAQKEFRLGFVLLSRPGVEATDAQVAAVQNIRRAIATRMGILTGGRALIHSYLEPKAEAEAGQGNLSGAGVRQGPADLAQGMAWLRARQDGAGAWSDNNFTTARDTSVVFDTLREIEGAGFGGRQKALEWFATQQASNTDYQARQLRSLSGAGVQAPEQATRLLALQNSDGGWGVAPRYQSNPLDTALALHALLPYESGVAAGKLAAAVNLLAARQNADGGWGNVAGAASRAAVSATVLQAFRGRALPAEAVKKAIAFLASRQQSDGGFGEGQSTVHDTANIMSALLAHNALGQIKAAEATAYISSSQRTDGSWDGSVYSTALAVRLLKSAGLFNWAASDLKIVPVAPLDGQQGVISFKVSNNGSASAPAGIARVYDGEAASANQIGADIPLPAMVVGDSAQFELFWNTRDKKGAHNIVLLVDPDNTVTEASKADNRVQSPVTVRDAPVPVELVVNASDVSASPARPNALPTTVAISALISNIGRTDAANVRIVLRAGSEPTAAIIDERILNLLGRSQQVVNFSASVTRAGATSFTVSIDPDARITEADKTNNSAAVVVETVSALDVAVRDAELTIVQNPVFLGADATFKFNVRNVGTQSSPPFKARFTVSNGTRTLNLGERSFSLAAGAASEQELVWRSDMAGTLSFKVELDPDQVLSESDETNNSARIGFQVSDVSGANLSVSYRDFSSNPVEVLENQPVVLTQIVKNSGNVAATNIEVAFYDGDPAAGRLIGTVQKIASLAAGAQASVSTTWARYPDAADHLIFVVADPAAKISDIDRGDNASFMVLSAVSVPDLAIAAGGLLVTPALPTPGDPLTLSATIDNLGKQSAANVVVRAFDGDPARGGVQVGSDQIIASFPGLSSYSLTFAFPASGASRTRTIYVVVDPANTVFEKNESNNSAQRDVMAQDGNFQVANRYFSPNGDAIMDTTTLGIRLPQPTDITVEVVGRNGKVVRIIGGDALKNVTNTSVVWDGLSQRGTVVPDGDYTLRVVSRTGAPMGKAVVTVDTNRSSILRAIDTPFGQLTNLTCEMAGVEQDLWGANLRMTTGDQRAFVLGEVPNVEAGKGMYSMLLDGAERRQILQQDEFDAEMGYSASLDGAWIAYVEQAGNGHNLWTMSGEGKFKKKVAELADRIEQFSMNADGTAVVVRVAGVVTRYARDGLSPAQELFGAAQQAPVTRMLVSPDRNTLLLTSEAYRSVRFFMVDANSGRIAPTPQSAANMEQARAMTYYWETEWAPNSKLITMSGYAPGNWNKEDGYRIWLFDNAFNLVRTYKYQPSASLPNYESTGLGRPTWSSDSTEFAFSQDYCLGDGGNRCARSDEFFAKSAVSTSSASSTGEPFWPTYARGLVVADALSERLEMVNQALPAYNSEYFWVPHERTVLQAERINHYCDGSGDHTCLYSIDLDDSGKVRPLFDSWRLAGEQGGWDRFAISTIGFSPAGSKLAFTSFRDGVDYSSACYGTGADHFLFGTLLNLTADLRAIRSASAGGLILRGSASDANFARYVIEYADKKAPTVWKTVAPASNEPVADAVFTTWVPPAYGAYLLRLTVEDLAGNKRQQIRHVSWTDTPSITDLYKDIEFVSPNGDGVKDGMQLHYKVLEPVHLVFNIYDEAGNRVRTVERNHRDLGQEQVFQWDGRDDRGRPVADGKYRIAVLDYEFFVTIDGEPPVLAVALGDAYGFRINNQKKKFTDFAPVLSWKGADMNLYRFAIEYGAGDEPASWSEMAGAEKLEDAVTLTSERFSNIRYRGVMEDKAGNRTIVSPALGTEQLFLLNYSLAGDTQPPRWAPFPESAVVERLPAIEGIGVDPVRLTFAESVRKPVAKVIVQYREIAPEDASVPVAALDARGWSESLITRFIRIEPGTGLETTTAIPNDHLIDFRWDMDGVKMDTAYLMRLKVLDDAGKETIAVSPYRMVRQPPSVKLEISVDDGRPQQLTANVRFIDEEPAITSELIIKSDEDPRFATARTVHTVENVLGDYRHFVGEAAELDLRPCMPYTVTVRVLRSTGQTISADYKLEPRCLGADWIVAPQTVQSCNATPSGMMHVTLIPFSKDGRRLTQLLFGRILADGRLDVINNWNAPQPDQKFSFDLDATALPVGMAHYVARVINEDGKQQTSIVNFPVAHAPSVVRITSPVQGQKVCGVSMADPKWNPKEDPNGARTRHAVAIEANVADIGNVSYGLEMAPASAPESWRTFSPAHNVAQLDGFTGLRNEDWRSPGNRLCLYKDSPLCGDFHPLSYTASKELALTDAYGGAPAHSGTLGHLGLLEDVEGEVTVRLRVFNEAGAQTCSAPVTFDFDNKVRMATPSLNAKLFSPKAESGPNRAILTVATDESVNVDVQVFAATVVRGAVVSAPTPIRSLASAQLVNGEALFEWDGLTDGGAAAADGLYQIRTTATDGCGNVAVHSNQVVELDATAPAVVLVAPATNGRLSLIALVVGSVRDSNFASYAVEYEVPSNPDVWLPLRSRQAQTAETTTSEELVAWNTLGLNGPVTLRIRALDRAGNVTDLRRALEVISGSNLISYIEPLPAVFSPNGDGKRDTTTIRYGLLAPSAVTLELHQGSAEGPLLRTLLSNQNNSAGAASAVWDGLDSKNNAVTDGLVFAKLVASSSELAIRQEESIQITLDRTRPEVDIIAPAGAVVTGQRSATVLARDAYLTTFTAALQTAAKSKDWEPLGEFSDNGVATNVLDLSALPEGMYALKLNAYDEAENSNELIRKFEIDNTVPVVTLSAPLADSYVSSAKGTVAIAGTVLEKNLAKYELRVGPGMPNPQMPLLDSGTSSAVAKTWDVSRVSDGNYTVWLSATDLAGQVGSASATVIVDNTAPVALISSPAAQGYMTRAGIIKGSATDANLQAYTLEIAPGAKGVANRWSQLHTSSEAVDKGTLLDWQALPVDGVYTLRLKVSDKAGHDSEALAEVVLDTKAPAAPLSLVAALENRNEGHLSWNANAEPDVAGYAVYRNGVRITPQLLTAPAYLDPALATGTYMYTVKAFDKAGWESASSEPVALAVNVSGPVARIFSPAEGALVGQQTDVRGIATASVDFKEYRLSVGSGASPSTWRLLRRSPAPVETGILASWDTTGLPEHSLQTLRIEAENIYGEVATHRSTVTVDNTPPNAPLQLTGHADGDRVTLSWTASSSTDVAGYIVLRDERIANAQGAVVGSWKPYLITNTNHIDLQVADGARRYVVLAMDQAENMSVPSNQVALTIDTRAPHASITDPVADAGIARKLVHLQASSPDTDIASVRFQYRAVGGVWADVGQAAVSAPYIAELDATHLDYGVYQLRAIATDLGGKTDPAPGEITVSLARTPEYITDLKASVNGADITLMWSSATADLRGYVLESPGTGQKVDVPYAANASYTFSGNYAGSYQFRVAAVDAGGVVMLPSDYVDALVHTPTVFLPLTPSSAASAKVTGKGAVAGKVTLVNLAAPAIEIKVDTAADGSFTIPAIALALGKNVFALTLRDGAGNVSLPVNFSLDRVDPPATPTGLAVDVMNGYLNLHWNPNVEPDLLGYQVRQNGHQRMFKRQGQYGSQGGAENSYTYYAFDDNPGTGWTTATGTVAQARGLSLTAWNPTPISQVQMQFASDAIAQDYDILVGGDFNMVTVAQVRNNQSTTVLTTFAPVNHASIYVALLDAPERPVTVMEMTVSGPEVVRYTSAAMYPQGPNDTFEVLAMNRGGMQSAPAVLQVTTGLELSDLATVASDITVLPSQPKVNDAVTLASLVRNLSSTAANNVDVHINVTDAQGVVTKVLTLNGDRLEAGAEHAVSAIWRPSAAGVYTIAVKVDPLAKVEETDESNNVATLTVTVGPAAPLVPVTLVVSAPPTGALQLNWTVPETVSPDHYLIAFAPVAAGPFTTLQDGSSATSYLDDSAENGVPRYYMVSALNADGVVIGKSGVMAGTARDSVAPRAPVLWAPTVNGKPVTVTTATTDVAGVTEPGAAVSLLRDGVLLDVGTASTDVQLKTLLQQSAAALFDISPDGRKLLSAGSGALISDLGTGVTTPAAWATDISAVRFAHSGAAVGVTLYDTANRVQVYDLSGTKLASSAELDNVQGKLTWSPDDQQIAFFATLRSTSEQGLLLFNPATGDTRMLAPMGMWQVDGKPSWSPDGKYIAFVRDDAVNVIKADDGSQVFAHTQSSRSPSWSADGARLIYTYSATDGSQALAELSMADLSERDVLRTFENLAAPFYLGSDQDRAFFNGGALTIRAADGTPKAVMPAANFDYERTLALVTGDVVLADRSGLIARVNLPGSFRFLKAPLKEGANAFSAVAADKAGNKGTGSLPIIVNRISGAGPDLAASITDLVLLPNAPLAGEAGRLTANVRNSGLAAAGSFDVAITLVQRGAPVRTLYQGRIETLAAGKNQSITLDWAPAAAGQYELVMTLDPRGEVVETNEANNVAVRTVSVAADALPTMQVALGAASYGANAALSGDITLGNAGPQVSGTLTMRVEDLDGYLVEILPPAAITLAYGQTQVTPLTWNTGAVLAGEYRIAAQLRGAAEAPLVAASANFRITPVHQLSATISTGQAQYRKGQDAAIAGQVQLAQGNASLTNAVATVTVRNSAGTQVHTFTQPLGTLAPGAAVAVNTLWNTGSSNAGSYTVIIEVTAGGPVLASANTEVTVVVDALAQLGGSMTPSSPTVSRGDALSVRYDLLNSGNVALDGVPLSVSVVDTENRATLAKVDASITLAPGAAMQGESAFKVDTWPLKTLQLVLAAEVDGKAVVLQRSALRVLDRTAPVARFALAEQSGTLFVPGTAALLLQASDSESLLGAVEFSLGGSAWRPMTLENREQGLYSVSLAGMTQGPYRIQARASDAANNVSAIALLDVVLDTIDPVIAITGVTDGASYSAAVTPVVEVSDANLKSAVSKLDGVPYVAGTAVSRAGSHTLVVDAEDKAGNKATRTLRFVIGGALPAVSAVAPLPGALLRTPFDVVATASSQASSIATVEYQLDGGVWTALAAAGAQYRAAVAALADGSHQLALRATDADQQSSTVPGYAITVDNTAPVITVTGVTDAASYTAPVTPVVAVADAHAGSTTVLLDGAAFVAGKAVASLGAHELLITALDAAGNRAELRVRFTLAEAALRLTGSVSVTPKEVQGGAVVAIARSVVNGGAAVEALVLELSIVDKASNAVMFVQRDSVNLAAGATWNEDRGWTVTGTPGTVYVARLASVRNGVTTLIAQDEFVVAAPAASVQFSSAPFRPQHILVLSLCKRPSSAMLGMCASSTIPADDPVALGQCDTTRAAAVVRYLNLLGVSHKLVTTEADFARELKTGGYTGYWVSAGGTKLREPLQTELAASLQLGETLLADGMHDLRAADKPLLDMAGVYSSGRFALGAPKLYMLGDMFPAENYSLGNTFVPVLIRTGATQQCAFRMAPPTTSTSTTPDCWGPEGFVGDGVACSQPASNAGVVTNVYGTGRTLYFSFDWVEAFKNPATEQRWVAVGRTGFQWLQPAANDGPLIAGEVSTRKITLLNTGSEAAFQVEALLPLGAKALINDLSAEVVDTPAGQRVRWELKLGAAQSRELSLQIKAPLTAGQYEVRYSVSSSGANPAVLSRESVQMQVSGLATLTSAAQEATSALEAAGPGEADARADTLRWIGKAQQSSEAGEHAQALRELTMAYGRLKRIGGNTAAAQQAVARMIRAIERRQ